MGNEYENIDMSLRTIGPAEAKIHIDNHDNYRAVQNGIVNFYARLWSKKNSACPISNLMKKGNL
jgi:hypothetical protein